MSSIAKRYTRSFLLSYYKTNIVKCQNRYSATDQQRPTSRPRSSIKGVELLRNPSLNKVK